MKAPPKDDATKRGDELLRRLLIVRAVHVSLPAVKELAQSYLDKADEDWTFVDPEDVKRLARAVLESGR